MTNQWTRADAQCRFDEMLAACLRGQAQQISRDGETVAVLLSAHDWQHLLQRARPSLKELLLAPHARTDTLVPARREHPHRRAADLD